ncbi:2-oxoglutarate ferredoxin oxidoreductase subunit gamma [Elusimicrobium simillimum]|uniref:2-oxoacid:acceptor oxidoreductase family protein n=1 Tax=Elusimicrobium simillimum TaxID=3143438 RepID=UPI003C6F0773
MYQGIKISGFGGQGVVSAGVLLAQAGLIDGKNASWFPSYGPEMRGGTANCSVVVASEEVYTPIVTAPDTVIVMNEPSLAKFEPTIKPGGLLIINTSLVHSKPTRTDIKVLNIACNELAAQLGTTKVANLIALGAFVGATGAVSIDAIAAAMKKVFKRAKPEMLDLNRKALEAGAAAAK